VAFISDSHGLAIQLLLASCLLACAIAFAADTTLAPNSEEFHKLYGDPASTWRNYDEQAKIAFLPLLPHTAYRRSA